MNDNLRVDQSMNDKIMDDVNGLEDDLATMRAHDAPHRPLELEETMALPHLRCQFCHNHNFTKETVRQTHMSSRHFYCQSCDIWFNDEGARRQHWSHSPEHNLDYSEKHGKFFKDESRDTDQPWRAKNRELRCGRPCDSFSKTARELAIHRVEKHWGHLCPFCGTSHITVKIWDSHMNNRHHWRSRADVMNLCDPRVQAENYAVFKYALTYCRPCKISFRDYSSQIDHQVLEHGYPNNEWRCKENYDKHRDWLSWFYGINNPAGQSQQTLQDKPEVTPPEERKPNSEKRDTFWDDFRNEDHQSSWNYSNETKAKEDQAKTDQERRRSEARVKDAQAREQRKKDGKAYWDKVREEMPWGSAFGNSPGSKDGNEQFWRARQRREEKQRTRKAKGNGSQAGKQKPEYDDAY